MKKTQETKKTSTQRTWEFLQRIAVLYFQSLNQQHPEWTVEDLAFELNMPTTTLLIRLARTSGFTSTHDPTVYEIDKIRMLIKKGVWSEQVLCSETGISPEKVQQCILLLRAAYGLSPYGQMPYGGRNRKVSDGKSQVSRRVTNSGQFSYRGHLYTLGSSYRGRIAKLHELGKELIVTFNDRPKLILACRHTL